MASSKLDKDLKAFGFLSVDTVNSSQFSEGDRKKIHEYLIDYTCKKIEKYGGKKIKWLGDGGDFSFNGINKMLNAAEDLLINSYIDKQKSPDTKPFKIRICLHLGMAQGDIDSETFESNDYTWLCKNNKLIGVPDSIVITDDVYGKIVETSTKDKYSYHRQLEDEKYRTMKLYVYDLMLDDKLVEISKRYYEAKEDCRALAESYKVNIEELKRLLKTAELKGIVEKKTYVQIVTPRAIELEEEIKKEYNHLKKVRVVRYKGPELKKELARAAADEIRKFKIPPGSSIATSCGTTVMEIAKNLRKDHGDIHNIRIYPMIITMTAEMEEVSPAGIVSYFTTVFPDSTGFAAQFPKEETDLAKAKQRKEAYAQDCDFLMDGAQNAKFMITGLGKIGGEGETHSFNKLTKKLELTDKFRDMGAIGEFCYQPFTSDGYILEGPDLELFQANLINISLHKLQEKVENARKKPEDYDIILTVAGGTEKHKSILGGLKAKIFNCIIMDISTAEFISKNIDLKRDAYESNY
ncbi:MAG: hypothetical protein LUQ59_10135 [Methanothrix sp.]|nr:hypothetical protein [Methanothrix sp.]